VNGIGYSPESAAEEINEILSIYPLVNYDNSTPGAWLSICRSNEVRGRQAHAPIPHDNAPATDLASFGPT
jgi:hypothetical protein